MPLISKNFSDIITFTRASTGTYFNSAGTLTSAAIDAPRLDYNPSTLAAQGLLIEESRVNSIRNNTMVGAVAGTPGTLPTNWTSQSVGGVALTEVVGVGVENGISYVDVRYAGTTASTAIGGILTEGGNVIAALAAQNWASSSFVRLVAGSLSNITSVSISIFERNAGGTLLAQTNTSFIPTNAALNTQRQAATRTLTDATTAFVQQRISITPVSGAAIDITLRIGLPQLELGAFATSVIPTTTTALTRAADVASVNTLSPWFNAAAGTLYSEFVFEGLKSLAGQAITTFDDGTANNRIAQLATSANAMQNAIVVASAVDGNNTTPVTTYAANSTYKNAYAYAVNDFLTAINGTTGTTDTTLPALPSGLSNYKIGASTANTSNLWIRRITYYPRRLSNAELQAITA